MSKFTHDNLEKGQPLELLVADFLNYRQIPFGFNPYTGTDDPRREDYDIYAGPKNAETFYEVKMDWLAALSGNFFFEKKAIYNTKADKFIVARPWITVFDTQRIREFFEAKNRVRRLDGTYSEQPLYKHVQGGDQAGNEGVLVPCKEANQFGKPLWEAVRELTQQQ